LLCTHISCARTRLKCKTDDVRAGNWCALLQRCACCIIKMCVELTSSTSVSPCDNEQVSGRLL
jgi:hypothetical protein